MKEQRVRESPTVKPTDNGSNWQRWVSLMQEVSFCPTWLSCSKVTALWVNSGSWKPDFQSLCRLLLYMSNLMPELIRPIPSWSLLWTAQCVQHLHVALKKSLSSQSWGLLSLLRISVTQQVVMPASPTNSSLSVALCWLFLTLHGLDDLAVAKVSLTISL